MLAQVQETPTEYVTDGLVLWLDGINKGNDNTKWTDLVSGIVFNGVAVASDCFGPDYVQIGSNANTVYQNADFVGPSVDNGTIEVVYESDDINTGQIILLSPRNENFAFAFYGGDIVWVSAVEGSTISRPRVSNAPVFGSVSISANSKFINGVSANTGNNDIVWYNAYQAYEGLMTSIGRRLTNQGFRYNQFKGKIYCIRIYNRQLTQAEVLANYAVDQSRFSLFN